MHMCKKIFKLGFLGPFGNKKYCTFHWSVKFSWQCCHIDHGFYRSKCM